MPENTPRINRVREIVPAAELWYYPPRMPPYRHPARPRPANALPGFGWGLILFVGVLALGTLALLQVWPGRQPPAAPPSAQSADRPPKPPDFRQVVFPTDQDLLSRQPERPVFQPTAAGRPESALFGSVRTVQTGRGLAASFHEGVDIAPLRRDRQGRPLDEARAIAAGTVAYVNRVAGNSNYGTYVVLRHADPLGEAYTLYAHLAQVRPGLQAGQPVTAGQALGTVGRTPTSIIPAERAHLHFEVGLIANARFGAWFRGRGLKPDHGLYNGWNLLAISPLDFFAAQREDADFSLQSHLRRVPEAFVIVLRCPHALDFFRRYPGLWSGPPPAGGTLVLGCTENGLPLRGRAAEAGESARLGRHRAAVLQVNETVLGRNGTRLVVRHAAGWRLGESGVRWLDILTYP
jgi:murein DD-endopeptidase MepM/ murein hydrolase activator NlpD